MRPYARHNFISASGRLPTGGAIPARGTAVRMGSAAARNLAIGAVAGLFALAHGHAFAAPLSVTLLLPDGKPLAGAVVMAQPVQGGSHPAAPVSAVMDQVDRAFAPDLIVVPVNSTVSFPNSDSVSHQIYSFSPAKRFQLPLYRGKPYPPVRFDQPGVITLGCNIHDEMLAYIVVTDAPFFGRSASDGSWTVEVPPGNYRINIWHPRIRDEDKDLHGKVTVAETTGGVLRMRLQKSMRPAPLEGRPHSWDGY
jgi:plastocyanin